MNWIPAVTILATVIMLPLLTAGAPCCGCCGCCGCCEENPSSPTTADAAADAAPVDSADRQRSPFGWLGKIFRRGADKGAKVTGKVLEKGGKYGGEILADMAVEGIGKAIAGGEENK